MDAEQIMNGPQQRVFDLCVDTLRSVQGADWDLEGLAAPYNRIAPITDEYEEEILPRCFRQSIDQAHARKVRKGTDGEIIYPGIPLYLNHAHHEPAIGRSVAYLESEEGLIGRWKFANTDSAHEAREMVRDGITTSFSVGFTPTRDGNVVMVRGVGEPTLIQRKKARLLETSLTSIPVYEDAQVTVVRAGLLEPPRPRSAQLRRWLESQRTEA